MFTRKRAITFILPIVVLLALAGPSSANGILPGSAHRRDHADLKRMIRMRAPAPLDVRQVPKIPGGAVGAANDPPVESTSSTPSPSPSPSPTPSPQVSSDSSSVASSSSSSTSTSSSSTSSSSSASSTTSSSTSSTGSSSTTTSSSTSSTPASSSPTPNTPVSTPDTKSSPTTGNLATSVDSVIVTSHVAAPSSSSSSDNSQVGGSSLSHTTLTILIVLAASIGGCAIIWTIIRKWKFRPSAEFEDRLEPIDWQPTEHDSGLPTHRRAPSNASSFHSGNEHGGGLSRNDSQISAAPYNAAARSLTPLPEHDFTAGAATLAPVGGYADLARGPSPQPQMQENLMQRGPSLNRGYDPYSGVPPHHQGGYTAQDAYDYNHAGHAGATNY
ncbi:hypothetical protein EDB92DRAFT_1952215 [Lactarius akahatsu]|uniref:Uncharacterized protein n=1 Tax=Lactarius akahatsu TaxID=416441 RepID=A0AAD4Q420_9AGAM|nr:hypothetical protein EDB92DRAFT_1952215 [Lactarius akahatsu]